MAFDNDYLLNQIRSRAFIPSSQSTFVDSDILELATDELHNTVLPMIMGARSEFYVTSEDHAITTENASISIPARALGLSIRDVVEVRSDKEYPLSWLEPEHKDQSLSAGFYFQGNSLVLRGVTNTTIRIYYYLRPGNLVETSKAAKITAVDPDTNTVTFATIPSSWTSGTELDSIKAVPGFDNLAQSLVIQSIAAPDVVLNSVTGLSVGNWVSISGDSPVPQIPVEFYSYLAQLTAVKILEGIGDYDGMTVAQNKLDGLKFNALNLIAPRTKGQAKKLTGHLRNRSAWQFGRY